jgi:hypothetical protein
MIEILLVLYVTRATARIAELKGYSYNRYRALGIVAWFGSEIGGFLLWLTFMAPEPESYSYSDDSYLDGLVLVWLASIGFAILLQVLLRAHVKALPDLVNAPLAGSVPAWMQPQPVAAGWGAQPAAPAWTAQPAAPAWTAQPGWGGQPASAFSTTAPAWGAVVASPEAPTSNGRLVVLEAGRSSTITVPRGAHLCVGRAEEADVRLADPRIGRHQAMIEWSGSAWVVRDLGSTNPTRLLGPSGAVQHLRDDSGIVAGQLLMGDTLVTLCPAGS